MSEAAIYEKIERAIQFIETHFEEQPDLERIAQETGLSPHHFQRQFTKLAGISPKRFLQHTTLQAAKEHLTAQSNLLDTSFALGLSGPGRLHDLFIAGEAATPGEFKAGGKDITIEYGIHESPFGWCLIAITPHGICELDFRTQREELDVSLARLEKKWNRATFIRAEDKTLPTIRQIFSEGQASVQHLPLHLRGTNFQLKVWQALLRIPDGGLSDYSAIANAIGSPKATRAVGSAVGDNPLAYLIPCHRVLRKDGGIGGYATGTARKRTMLACEALSQKMPIAV